jgi:hypothetical protein
MMNVTKAQQSNAGPLSNPTLLLRGTRCARRPYGRELRCSGAVLAHFHHPERDPSKESYTLARFHHAQVPAYNHKLASINIIPLVDSIDAKMG